MPIDEVLEVAHRIDDRLPEVVAERSERVIENIPFESLVDLFKGRDEILEQLQGQLDGGGATAITQAIEGLGGIGKTRVAVEFGWWGVREKKYKAVLFVNAESSELLHASVAGLAGARVLGLAKEGVDQEVAERLVFGWLAENDGWLMVFDNADTREAAMEVEGQLPRLGRGQVIITSRYRKWGAAVRSRVLGVLSAKDAREFLLERTAGRRAETADDEGIVAELAEELGCLPLALEHTGGYVANLHISLGEYLAAWREEKEEVLKWYDEDTMKYPASVAVTWERTFKELSLGARTVLRLTGFLAPEPVALAIFQEGSEKVAEAMALLAQELGVGMEEFKAGEAIGGLARYSMVTRGEGTFTVHRMVQEVIRSRIPGDLRREWIEKTLRMVDDFAPGDSDDVRTWGIWDPLRPHAEAIAVTADEAGITEPTSRLMGELDCYLSAKGLYGQAEHFSRRALKIDEESLGKDHPKVATRLNNLAGLYRATNRLGEAEPLYGRVIEIWEKSLGKEHPDVAIALNNLATLYQVTNRLGEAEPLMRRALVIILEFTRRTVHEHPHLGDAINGYGGLLGEMGVSEDEVVERLKGLGVEVGG